VEIPGPGGGQFSRAPSPAQFGRTPKKSANPGLGVVVEGADDVDYQSMVDVLDLLRQLDITKVGLATGAGA